MFILFWHLNVSSWNSNVIVYFLGWKYTFSSFLCKTNTALILYNQKNYKNGIWKTILLVRVEYLAIWRRQCFKKMDTVVWNNRHGRSCLIVSHYTQKHGCPARFVEENFYFWKVYQTSYILLLVSTWKMGARLLDAIANSLPMASFREPLLLFIKNWEPFLRSLSVQPKVVRGNASFCVDLIDAASFIKLAEISRWCSALNSQLDHSFFNFFFKTLILKNSIKHLKATKIVGLNSTDFCAALHSRLCSRSRAQKRTRPKIRCTWFPIVSRSCANRFNLRAYSEACLLRMRSCFFSRFSTLHHLALCKHEGEDPRRGWHKFAQIDVKCNLNKLRQSLWARSAWSYSQQRQSTFAWSRRSTSNHGRDENGYCNVGWAPGYKDQKFKHCKMSLDSVLAGWKAQNRSDKERQMRLTVTVGGTSSTVKYPVKF